MKSQDVQTQWSKTLGASLSATLFIAGAGAEAASANDWSLVNIQPSKHLIRAERQLDRAERREQRIENRSIQAAASAAARASRANVLPTAGTIGVSQLNNLPIESRTNTALIYPGQISTFRTTRPERGGNRSTYINDAGNEKVLKRGVSLDLGSTSSNIKIGSNLFDGSVTISVGGQEKQVTAGDRVTAAEYAALTQLLATGDQGLVLSGKGAATGGALNLNTVSDNGKTIRASELVIPENVIVAGDFARNADGVSVKGNIENSGSIYAISTNAAKNTAIIGARDITNQSSGLITTDVPSEVAGQFGSVNSTLNLTLNANRDFSNDGTITSSGDLNLAAGRNFSNTGLTQSAGNLNLTSSNIINTGDIASVNQNVNIGAAADAHINVNNTTGSINALNGDINIATVSVANQKLNTTLIGGNWHANELNISSSDGGVIGNLGDVTARVNIKAGTAHFHADTDGLKLGDMTLTGDPLFSATGDLVLDGDFITAGNPLAFVAGGNIVRGTTDSISTTSGTIGGTLTFIAGAAFTGGGGSPAIVTGPSATGGSIDLSGITTISTAGPSGGGNVLMVAWAGSNANSGEILTTAFIVTNGGSGNSGGIKIIGDGAQINVAGLVATSTGPNDGSILVAGATPQIVGTSFDIAVSGATTGTINATTYTDTDISLGFTQIRGAMDVATAGDTSVGNISSGPGPVRIIGKNVSSTGAVSSSGAVSFLALENLDLFANINSTGGILGVAGRDITTRNSISISTASPTLAGSDIAFIAGANFNLTTNSVIINGATTAGGNVNFTSFGAVTLLSTSSGLASSSSGDLSLVAYRGLSSDGTISLPGALQVDTSYTGNTGSAGDIVIVGGATSGTAVSIGSISTYASNTTAGGNDVIIRAAQPNETVTINTDNVSYTGSFTTGPLTGGNITIGQIVTNAGSHTDIQTDGSLTTGQIETNGPGTAGTAGSLSLRVGQSGAITTGNIIANGFGAASGGTINIEAGATYNVGAIFATGGTTGNGGNVNITVTRNSLFQSGNITVESSAGAGGNITISNLGSGGIGVGLNSFNVNGFTDGGVLTLDATAGAVDGPITGQSGNFTFQVNSGIGFGAGSIYLAGSEINIPGNLSLSTTGGTGGIISLTTTTGNVAVSGTLTIDGRGDVFASTAGSIRTNPAVIPHNVQITARNNVTLGAINTSALMAAQSGGNVTIIAGGTTLTTGAITTSGGGTSAAGDINLTNVGNISVTSIAATGFTPSTVNLQTTGTGNVTISGAIVAGNLNITLADVDAVANLTGANQVNKLEVFGSGNVNFTNAVNLNLGTIQGRNVDIQSNTRLTFTEDFTSSASLTVSAPVIDINGANIQLSRFVGQNPTGGLEVYGGNGTITATNPAAGVPGSPSNPAAITFATANGSALDLFGTLSFFGDVFLNNFGGTTTSHTNSQFIGNNNVTLTTDTWIQQTNGNITGNKFIFTGYTIANNAGNVELTQDIIFQGRSVAIIASGNINIHDFDIVLSNPSGDGGNLIMIAGVNFDYPPPGNQIGQITSQGIFSDLTLDGVGSITGTGSIILTGGGTGGDGGSLIAIANLGSISLTGAINTSSATGTAGDVYMVAPNGITVGNITATSSSSNVGGDVTLLVAAPTLVPNPGPAYVEAGLLKDAYVSNQGLTAASLVVNNVNTGNGGTYLQTMGNITVGDTLTGHSIVLRTEVDKLITFNSVDSLTATANAAGNGGYIEVTGSTIVNPGGTFAFNVNGTSGNGGTFSYLTNSNTVVGTGGDITVTATGLKHGGYIEIATSGDLTINAGGIVASHARGHGAIIVLEAGTVEGTLTLNDTSFLAAANATGVPGDNFDGGSIELAAFGIDYVSSATSPLLLSANGFGTGNAGSVSYAVSESTPTYFGAPRKKVKGDANFLRISATSGSIGGDAGAIRVSTGGNITISDTTFIDAHTNATTLARGAEYYIAAGNTTGKEGYLVINGDLNADSVGGGVGGSIVLISSNKKDFILNNGRVPKNGISGTLSASGPDGSIVVWNNGGGVEVATQDAVDSENLALITSGKGTVKVGKNVVITAKDLVLFTQFGTIGKKPLQVNAERLSLLSVGSSINVNNQFAGVSTLTLAATGKNLTVSSANGLTLGPISAADGDITITANGGALTVNGDMIATDGGIVLSNRDVDNGTINIADGVRVETAGKGDDIKIAIGAPPKKGTNQAPPAGVTVDAQGTKGKAFFGPVGGVVATGTAQVNVINKDVIFNNLSTGTNKITLGNNVVIQADPPSRVKTSIDTSSIIPDLGMYSNVGAPLSATPVTMPPEVALHSSTTLGTDTLDLNGGKFGTALSTFVGGDTGFCGTLVSSTDSDTESSGTLVSSTGTENGGNLASKDDLLIDAKLHHGNTQTVHQLSNERAIFAPTQDTVIETQIGNVQLAAGTVALVIQSPSAGLSVYNLHDNHKNSVIVNVAEQKVVLPPGRHAHFSNQKRGAFADVNPVELVQHRSMTQTRLANGVTMYTSEFAIPSACYAVKPLKMLMTSNDAASKRLAKQIMKTSSVLMHLCPDKGDYVQHFKPATTAMIAN